jgi:D-amino-acid oxidase
MVSPASSSQNQKHIIIIGAGVTGLSTSLALLTSPSSSNYKITIIASHIPADLSPEYTSPWAGGHWRSHVGLSDADAETRSWDERTYKYWTRLLEDGEQDVKVPGKEGKRESMKEREERIGLGFRTCHYFWGKESDETRGGDGNAIWFRDVVQDFEILDLEIGRKKAILPDGKGELTAIPEGAIMGMKYRSICFDPPRYLSYLFNRVKDLGARIIKAKLDTNQGLSGIVKDAKFQAGEEDIFALINCSGLSARHFLPPSEAAKLFPIRGQTILIKGEASMTTTFVGIPGKHESEMLYVVPRPGSGATILGGCKQVNSWDEDVDGELNERILVDVKGEGFAEELRDSKGEFEVLALQVGFRPGRKGGARCEVEGDGKVDRVWVVHSYGHSGAGYQGSVGCAERVARLVVELERKDA